MDRMDFLKFIMALVTTLCTLMQTSQVVINDNPKLDDRTIQVYFKFQDADGFYIVDYDRNIYTTDPGIWYKLSLCQRYQIQVARNKIIRIL